MLPEPLPPPLEGPPSPSLKEGLTGRHERLVTRSVALAAAGMLGAVLVIGIPLLLHQQTKVSTALPDLATGPAAQEMARLTMLHWIALGLTAGASICLA